MPVGLTGVTAIAAGEYRSFALVGPPWTLKGFFPPVDSTPAGSAPIWNTVKGGSTVPLKFQVFEGTTPLTKPDVITQPLHGTGVACNGRTAANIELQPSGGTRLRYDAGSRQFIFNWKTPNNPGACYLVAVSADTMPPLTAYFKLK